jgi:hypothetical protein
MISSSSSSGRSFRSISQLAPTLVWLMNPRSRTVRVFAAGASEVAVYSGDAEITLDPLATGFRAPVSAFFPEL